MSDNTSYIIEPSIAEWRASHLDEDEIPRSLHFFSPEELSPIDAVYNARVTSVDSNLDMAFLDLGNKKTGMINVRRAKQLVKGKVGSISECLHEGQMLLVQAIADPTTLEQKAIPVTAKPRLLGRYLVIEAGSPRLNFSKDLPPRTLKLLKDVLAPFAEEASIIVRTGAMDIEPSAVEAEARWLIKALKPSDKVGLNFSITPLEQALLSSPVMADIIIDSDREYTQARTLARDRWPDLTPRLDKWDSKTAAFTELGIEDEIDEALADQIMLPSGGWISIFETPALTAIDVNVGGALKGHGAQDAILQVNLEAAMAVAHHLRFQDMGGLIIVDFINMSAKGGAASLMKLLDQVLKSDSVPVRHSGISSFGLVEFARKRKGISLRQRQKVQPAPTDRTQAVALSLLRSAEKIGLTAEPGNIIISASKSVEAWFQNQPSMIETLKTATNRAVTVNSSDKNQVQLG